MNETASAGDGVVASAMAGIVAERARLLPAGSTVVDCHTHLGVDEDGQRLTLDALLSGLDEVAGDARACAFALHDPERRPAYRVPNDRVLAWAAESGGRVIPYCRLDPEEDPVGEAERCLASGARGIKLHPRAQAFGFDSDAVASIFAVAREARVPILIHAGRGMPAMDSLADLALRFAEVPLVLAHGAIADQAMFATRLRDHPAVLYDTSCFSAFDVIELFARVSAERIVFGSDVPYGRTAGGIFHALRVAALAGLDDDDRRNLVGGTMLRVLAGEPLDPVTAPRIAACRQVNGRLLRVSTYLSMSFGALMGSIGVGQPPDPTRTLTGINLARAVCRDPEPGAAGEALARIDSILAAAEQVAVSGGAQALSAIALIQAASVIAATERVAA